MKLKETQLFNLRRSKRSQVQQVFIFILAILIAALILLFGYRMIGKFRGDIVRTALIDFQAELTGEIKKISSDFRSVKKLDINVPGGFKKVCILQQGFGFSGGQYGTGTGICDRNGVKQDDDDLKGGDFEAEQDYDLSLCSLWPENTNDQNVFLLPFSDVSLSITTVYVDLIEAGTGGYICLKPVNGRISLRLEGRGNHTRVSRWPLEI